MLLYKCKNCKGNNNAPAIPTFGFRNFEDDNSTLEDTERRNKLIPKNDSS